MSQTALQTSMILSLPRLDFFGLPSYFNGTRKNFHHFSRAKTYPSHYIKLNKRFLLLGTVIYMLERFRKYYLAIH